MSQFALQLRQQVDEHHYLQLNGNCLGARNEI